MSELSELGAVIASNIVAITGYIALFLKQRETEKKITNDHPLHLRDDLDNKHEKVVEEIDSSRPSSAAYCWQFSSEVEDISPTVIRLRGVKTSRLISCK